MDTETKELLFRVMGAKCPRHKTVKGLALQDIIWGETDPAERTEMLSCVVSYWDLVEDSDMKLEKCISPDKERSLSEDPENHNLLSSILEMAGEAETTAEIADLILTHIGVLDDPELRAYMLQSFLESNDAPVPFYEIPEEERMPTLTEEEVDEASKAHPREMALVENIALRFGYRGGWQATARDLLHILDKLDYPGKVAALCAMFD